MKRGTKIAAALGLGAAALAGGAWYAYSEAFRADPRRTADPREIPAGSGYDECREASLQNIDALMETPYERVSIRSRDGLKLRGKLYEDREGAPVLLFFHGYRSTAERDGSGGFTLCQKNGWTALMADQRGHGESQGRTISFGIQERWDVLDWIDWAVSRFGEETPIFLVGVSMGAATVLMASALDLPPQVKGIWADCSYSSPEAVLRHTIRRRHLPEGLAWAFTRLGGRLFGGFDIKEAAPLEAVKEARVPILLIHGQADTMVPHAMAQELKDACAAPVTFLSVPRAPHGMSFYLDNAAYTQAVEKLVSDNL